MRVPDLYQIKELLAYTRSVSGSRQRGTWGPIRGLGFHGFCLKRRLSVAWRVFKGELDAAFLRDAGQTSGLEIEPLFSEPFIAVVPKIGNAGHRSDHRPHSVRERLTRALWYN